MGGYHSPRSPSSAHRWRACAPAVRESADLPDTAGEAAEQGTVFHHYAALALEFGIEPYGMIGSRLPGDDGEYREFTQEMADKMLSGLDYVWSLANYPGAMMFVEEWVDLEPWLGPKEGGTSDNFIIDLHRKKLTTFDWKWGEGVPVKPEWNDQGILYTLGVWNTFARDIFEEAGIDPSEIEVSIVIEQPRAPGGGGVWTVPLSTLLAEGKQIKKDADETRNPDAPYNPGSKQCQFCAAARLNTCRARAKSIQLMLMDDELDQEEMSARIDANDTIELVNRRSLTPEKRSYILLNAKLITGWLNQLHDEAMDDDVKGRPVPGMKRVAGRAGRRKWINEKKAEVILIDEFGKDDAYQHKLLSPAMADDEAGKEVYRQRFSRLVEQADPTPSLVPESDPKPALRSARDLLDEAWIEPDETESLI